MDYEKLMTVLPKPPTKWTVADIQTWLRFIGLESLYPAFKTASIDGSCLPSLCEQDLRSELSIKSTITVKKLMNWINVGLKEYGTYITSMPQIRSSMAAELQQLAVVPHTMSKGEKIPRQKQQPMLIENPPKELQFTTLEKPGPDQPKKHRIELIIKHSDNDKNIFYSLREDGGSIGRHSTNTIVIIEESVSRYHARIECHNGEFFLRDVGSTTGTFIKVDSKLELQQSMLIEMGSNYFRVERLDKQFFILNQISAEKQEQDSYTFEVTKNMRVSIGRRTTNQISFPDDQHLSNSHATIFEEGGRLYLQDLHTTNGYNIGQHSTWLRLADEGEQSAPYPLTNNTIFRLGATLTYSCKKNLMEVVEKPNPNACAECKVSDRDCLFMPCRHVVTCIGCSSKYAECLTCGVRIEESIRLYLS